MPKTKKSAKNQASSSKKVVKRTVTKKTTLKKPVTKKTTAVKKTTTSRASQNPELKKSHYLWPVYVVLILLILGLLIFLFYSLASRHLPGLASLFGSKSSSSSASLLEKLTTPPSPTPIPMNPDWQVQVTGQTGNQGEGALNLSIGQPRPQDIPLDQGLDAFAREFIAGVDQQQWTNLAISVDPTSLPQEANTAGSTEQFFTLNFNDWARNWAIRNFRLDDININYSLNKDFTMDGHLILVWTFTNQLTGEPHIYTTSLELIKTDNPDHPYQWKFDMGAFPDPAYTATASAEVVTPDLTPVLTPAIAP